jgi:hypothetical protein
VEKKTPAKLAANLVGSVLLIGQGGEVIRREGEPHHPEQAAPSGLFFTGGVVTTISAITSSAPRDAIHFV